MHHASSGGDEGAEVFSALVELESNEKTLTSRVSVPCCADRDQEVVPNHYINPWCADVMWSWTTKIFGQSFFSTRELYHDMPITTNFLHNSRSSRRVSSRRPRIVGETGDLLRTRTQDRNTLRPNSNSTRVDHSAYYCTLLGFFLYVRPV